MHPKRDWADQLDEALERRRAGSTTPEEDREMEDLLQLAARLERELPEDLPDPEFRVRLKEQLIGTPAPPINLGLERRRRSVSPPWQIAAFAATLAAALIVAIVIGWDGLPTNRQAQQDAAQPAIAAREEAPINTFQAPPPASVAPSSGGSESAGVAAAPELPPLDEDHVLHPVWGFGGGLEEGATPVPNPRITWTFEGATPPLPEQARIYRFSAPTDGDAFLRDVASRLGVTGDVMRDDTGPAPSISIEGADGRTIQWFDGDAYFMYSDNRPIPAASSDGHEDPAAVARRWLESIGFDLASLRYETSVAEHPDGTAMVTFAPADLPAPDFGVQLGMMVGIGPDGQTVTFANGYWLTLSETQELPLKTSDEAVAALQAGEVFWEPFNKPRADTSVTVDSVEVSYILTRGDDGALVLQPAIKFQGQTEPGVTPERAVAFVTAGR